MGATLSQIGKGNEIKRIFSFWILNTIKWVLSFNALTTSMFVRYFIYFVNDLLMHHNIVVFFSRVHLLLGAIYWMICDENETEKGRANQTATTNRQSQSKRTKTWQTTMSLIQNCLNFVVDKNTYFRGYSICTIEHQ